MAATAHEMETGRDQRPVTAKVWDPFIRFFHWSLVILFALAWLTEDRQALHRPIGYAILALVILRTVWGFIGSKHARFSDSVWSPRATLEYARGLLAGTAPRVLGHNPLAGVMILALLAMLLATGASGWLMTTGSFGSTGWLEELHEALATLTLALVGLHVLAVLVMSAVHGENLVHGDHTVLRVGRYGIGPVISVEQLLMKTLGGVVHVGWDIAPSFQVVDRCIGEETMPESGVLQRVLIETGGSVGDDICVIGAIPSRAL
jgi:cytochrome b